MENNDCYKIGRKITPKGIMVHSTATPGVMAADWFSRWNRSYKAGEINRQVCAHAFLDDVEVWQYLPWNHRGWHAGGAANNTHIGIEICEPNGFTYSNGANMIGYDARKQKRYFRKAWQNAVDLCVMLCQKYGLSERDIICHSEGHKKGIASNHADVMHWFPKHGESMDSFRAAVRVALNKKDEPPDSPTGIAVDDVVEIKATVDRYYPGGPVIPDWVRQAYYHKVTQVISNGKPVIKGGKACVLLGKRIDKKSGKESVGIMSWIDKGALIVIVPKETERSPEAKKQTVDTKYYRVQVGAFSEKENAEDLLGKIKAAGFKGFVKYE